MSCTLPIADLKGVLSKHVPFQEDQLKPFASQAAHCKVGGNVHLELRSTMANV